MSQVTVSKPFYNVGGRKIYVSETRHLSGGERANLIRAARNSGTTSSRTSSQTRESKTYSTKSSSAPSGGVKTVTIEQSFFEAHPITGKPPQGKAPVYHEATIQPRPPEQLEQLMKKEDKAALPVSQLESSTPSSTTPRPTNTATINGNTYVIEQLGEGRYRAYHPRLGAVSGFGSNAEAAARDAEQVRQDIARASAKAMIETSRVDAAGKAYITEPYYLVGGVKITERRMKYLPETKQEAIRYAAATGSPMPKLTDEEKEKITTIRSGKTVHSRDSGLLSLSPPRNEFSAFVETAPDTAEGLKQIHKKAGKLSGVAFLEGQLALRANAKAEQTAKKIDEIVLPFNKKWENRVISTPEEAYEYEMEKQEVNEKVAGYVAEFEEAQKSAETHAERVQTIKKDLEKGAALMGYDKFGAGKISQVAKTETERIKNEVQKKFYDITQYTTSAEKILGKGAEWGTASAAFVVGSAVVSGVGGAALGALGIGTGGGIVLAPVAIGGAALGGAIGGVMYEGAKPFYGRTMGFFAEHNLISTEPHLIPKDWYIGPFVDYEGFVRRARNAPSLEQYIEALIRGSPEKEVYEKEYDIYNPSFAAAVGIEAASAVTGIAGSIAAVSQVPKILSSPQWSRVQEAMGYKKTLVSITGEVGVAPPQSVRTGTSRVKVGQLETPSVEFFEDMPYTITKGTKEAGEFKIAVAQAYGFDKGTLGYKVEQFLETPIGHPPTNPHKLVVSLYDTKTLVDSSRSLQIGNKPRLGERQAIFDLGKAEHVIKPQVSHSSAKEEKINEIFFSETERYGGIDRDLFRSVSTSQSNEGGIYQGIYKGTIQEGIFGNKPVSRVKFAGFGEYFSGKHAGQSFRVLGDVGYYSIPSFSETGAASSFKGSTVSSGRGGYEVLPSSEVLGGEVTTQPFLMQSGQASQAVQGANTPLPTTVGEHAEQAITQATAMALSQSTPLSYPRISSVYPPVLLNINEGYAPKWREITPLEDYTTEELTTPSGTQLLKIKPAVELTRPKIETEKNQYNKILFTPRIPIHSSVGIESRPAVLTLTTPRIGNPPAFKPILLPDVGNVQVTTPNVRVGFVNPPITKPKKPQFTIPKNPELTIPRVPTVPPVGLSEIVVPSAPYVPPRSFPPLSGDWLFSKPLKRIRGGKASKRKLPPRVNLLDVFAYEAKTGKEFLHPSSPEARRRFEHALATGTDFFYRRDSSKNSSKQSKHAIKNRRVRWW